MQDADHGPIVGELISWAIWTGERAVFRVDSVRADGAWHLTDENGHTESSRGIWRREAAHRYVPARAEA